ncbi:hypothetical protein FQJ03_02655 [Escherichia coli]|nr:hypothetical protein [Escherichia coli]
MALSTNNSGVLYIRVELPRVYGKYRVQFDLIQYVDHPVTDEKAEVGRDTMECDYDLNGPNIFEQCYNYAKLELPYATIDC